MTDATDFRKRTPTAQEEARRNAVAMVKSGMTRIAAAKIVNVNRRFVQGNRVSLFVT